MKINFFKSPSQFRNWLSKNHDKAQELCLGIYKTHTGKPGMTYSEALDEALPLWLD
ncbi:MAG TPA: hypothetical protein VE978_25540 [Chitinophagales bacterium]|nr:hypothetical protein [Chitinophagales bacterium]